MKVFHLSLLLTIAALQAPLFADKQSDDAAEKRRQEYNQQEQQIQERKIEDQQFDQRRLDQERINRQLEDRRQEQRRLDNARDRRLLAVRGSGHKRPDFLGERNDLLNDTLRAQTVEKAENQYYQESYQNETASEPQTGCASCAAGDLTCQDRKALDQLEEEDKCEEVHHEQRKAVVEQWDRDHSRD